jgi:hypothetical protein
MRIGDELSAVQVAELYLEQLDRWIREEKWIDGGVNAITVWERWISKEPERAWPVFLEIIAQRPDDETLYQVSHRLRLLLHRHWNAFHERAEALVRDTPRFARVVGGKFFDPDEYREKPLDIQELIHAYELMDLHSTNGHAVDAIVKRDADRGFRLAIEIIHRGPEHGMSSFDTFSGLRDLLQYQGPAVIERVEAIARESYLVRRCLWRIIPSQRGTPEPFRIRAEIWQLALAARGETTDFTDDTEPQPQAQRLSPADEELIASWFIHENNFWACSEMDDLVTEKPETAWPILLQMLNHTSGQRIFNLAAGPLEDLLERHGTTFIDRIAAEARQNEKVREALTGVWISKSEVYPRYLEVMAELGLDVK